MTELTGPQNCAECGSEFTREIIMAGGSKPATVIVRGHHLEIPGLYRCTGCTEAILMGVRESSVTLERARDYLNDVFGPTMIRGMQMAADNQDELLFIQCIARLDECMEMQAIFEACIGFQAEPGGLDFIPECDGHCGEENHADPRQMAHLN